MDPQQAILDNLVTKIRLWQDQGDKIIVLTDFNNDIRQSDVVHFFAGLGLYKVHLANHGMQVPPTYQWGQHPINRIYGPPHIIDGVKWGYLAFGNGVPTNH